MSRYKGMRQVQTDKIFKKKRISYERFRQEKRENPASEHYDCRRLNKLGIYIFPYSNGGDEFSQFSSVLLGAVLSFAFTKNLDGRIS